MQRLYELGAFDSVLLYVTRELGNPSLHAATGVPAKPPVTDTFWISPDGATVSFTFAVPCVPA